MLKFRAFKMNAVCFVSCGKHVAKKHKRRDLHVRADRAFYAGDKQKKLAEEVNQHISLVILCTVSKKTIGS
jgi:hypothetical protein